MSNKKTEEIIKQIKKEYFKEWRAKNKDKVRKSNQNYWKKKAEQKLKESENNDK